MKSLLIRGVLVGSCVLSGMGAWLPPQAWSAAPAVAEPQEQDTSVAELVDEAVDAVKHGKFDLSNTLLARASKISEDPSVDQMATWAAEYEAQRQKFTDDRRKQYEKAVADVHKLLDAGLESYAIDSAARAQLLVEDKEAFSEEPWVVSLIAKTIELADQADREENWLRALRLYSDLSLVQPSEPQWKERLKLSTRRLRLLGLYAPDVLKEIQDAESKERKRVDDVIPPATTQPTTQSADGTMKGGDEGEAAVMDDQFRVDWHETLRDVKKDMLTEALNDTRVNYYRDITSKHLLLGGLKGLRTIATTRGLEKTFPGLGDPQKRDEFLQTLDECEADGNAAAPAREQFVLQTSLHRLNAVNARTINLPQEVLISEFADGAFGELDPFSSMIWPSDLAEFNKNTQGEFIGVGIQIQTDSEGYLKVISPLPDSPAYRAKLAADDIITHIDGRNAKGISLNQAVRNITGPSGTHVTLTVKRPDGTKRDVRLRRETIHVESVQGYLHLPGGGWDYLIDPDQKIAMIRLKSFTKGTTEELEKALEHVQRQGARAIILDLRYNPGGLLAAATEVTDKFLSEGLIVSTRADRETPNQPSHTKANDDNDEVKLPMVVLVNQYSASASEIVSGALKDQGRALVVGERTFGKGSVQMLFPLHNRDAYLKLTTSHYYLPSGRCIHREENSDTWGVDPDVRVEMTPDQMRAQQSVRQELDVLREAQASPAEGALRKLQDIAPAVEDAVEGTTDEEKPDLLSSDPQLSAALLMLRLQLNSQEDAVAGR